MNFKSLIALGLGVATLGLSLPAFAEKATILSTDQEIVVTGDKNTKASSYDRGNRDSAGIDASTKQKADILGDKNDTRQRSNTEVRETRVRNK
jgi:hypothetical protein